MSPENPNVAVVVLDTLRKDAFDEHFEWLPGRRFENAYSPGHWTVPAHAALFTGRYPSEIGVHAKSPTLDCPDETLAERLSETEYRTRAFSCNVNIAPPSSFDRGFSTFQGNWRVESLSDDVFDWGQFTADTERSGVKKYLTAISQCVRSDADTLASLKRGALLKLRDFDVPGFEMDDGAREALDYVYSTEFGEREFCFLNLMEAHTPYNPPSEYRTTEPVEVDGLRATLTGPGVDQAVVRQAYDDSVRYLSDVYEEIFEALRENFEYVVTVADHGELLGEHGTWDHLYGVYPELTHVPLVVSGPGCEGRKDASVSLFDVHRTVLDLADVDHGETRGQSLLGDVTGEEVLTEYHGVTETLREALLNDGYAGIRDLDAECHGYAAPEDYYGYETHDRPGDDAPFVESGTYARDDDPESRLRELVDALDRRTAGGDTEVSEDVRRHLEDLGYA